MEPKPNLLSANVINNCEGPYGDEHRLIPQENVLVHSFQNGETWVYCPHAVLCQGNQQGCDWLEYPDTIRKLPGIVSPENRVNPVSQDYIPKGKPETPYIHRCIFKSSNQNPNSEE